MVRPRKSLTASTISASGRMLCSPTARSLSSTRRCALVRSTKAQSFPASLGSRDRILTSRAKGWTSSSVLSGSVKRLLWVNNNPQLYRIITTTKAGLNSALPRRISTTTGPGPFPTLPRSLRKPPTVMVRPVHTKTMMTRLVTSTVVLIIMALGDMTVQSKWTWLEPVRTATTNSADHDPDKDPEESEDASKPQVLATSAPLEDPSQEQVVIQYDHVGSDLHRGYLRGVRLLVEWAWEALQLSLRSAQIGLHLSPLLVLTPASMVTVDWCHWTWLSNWTWSYVLWSMQSLGPTFVKLCQWMATRRDIFPPAMCDRLAILYDRGWPHPWAHTHAVLVQAFGPDYADRGLQLDEQSPIIGRGSSAQVYRAVLVTRRTTSEKKTKKEKNHHDNQTGDEDHRHDEEQDDHHQWVRREVAVKVLHPNFAEKIDRDLWLMRTVAKWLHALPIDQIRMLNFPRVTENFGAILLRQADLRIEGDNLRKFRANFYGAHDQKEHRSAVTFPRPIEGWTSAQVLVEEYAGNARPIAEFLRDRTPEGLRVQKELARPLLQAFLKMVFFDNFVHGDLHPGNVLIQTTVVPVPEESSTGWMDRLSWVSSSWPFFRANTTSENNSSLSTSPSHETSSGRTMTRRTIVFLDAGITTTLSPNDQRNLRDLFRAVILNNGRQAGRLMVERAKYERCSQVEGCVEEFSQGVEKLVAEFHDRRREGLTLGKVRIGSLLAQVLDLCRVHGVEIDPAMASIVISTLVLEGLGRSLDADLNLIDAAVPFVIGRAQV